MLTPVVDCDQESYIGAQRRRDIVVSHQPPDCSHVKARPGVPPASAALTSSLPPPFLLPLVAVSTFSITLLHLEKSRRIASIRMQNRHHWRRCGSVCAGTTRCTPSWCRFWQRVCEGLSFCNRIDHRNRANIRWNVSRSSIFSCKTRKTMLLSIFR
jgi:hypothetical protein